MRWQCHLGWHRVEVTRMRFDVLVNVPIKEDRYDRAADGQEERWRPLSRCMDCGVLFALDWDLGD